MAQIADKSVRKDQDGTICSIFLSNLEKIVISQKNLKMLENVCQSKNQNEWINRPIDRQARIHL